MQAQPVEEKKLPERIVDRAVKLWVDALARPVYDNGDNSGSGILALGMVAQQSRNNTPEVLEKFAVELKKQIQNSRNQEWVSIDVDYNPCRMLADAAQAAGLDMPFPWKHRMCVTEQSVEFSRGYGRRGDQYYPLSNGKWLVTDLTGIDIRSIIQWIERGEPHPFKVED